MTDGSETLLLNQEDVIRAGGLDMKQAITDMEDVFRLKTEGDYVLPSKVVLRWGDMESELTRGRFNAMPGYIGGRFHMVGIKWISSVPKNVHVGLPRAVGTIILNDPETGMPWAIMDGTLISAMRTGAVTGLAARYFAKNDASTLGLIGAGVQSRTQLHALFTTCSDLSHVRIFDLDNDRAQLFAREMSNETGLSIEVVDSAEACARDSDLLVTATTAQQPIVHRDWLVDGTFYTSIHGREAAEDVVTGVDKVVVDNWDEVLNRGNNTVALMHADGNLSRSDVYCELEELVAGRLAGRQNESERIFFTSVGMGIEDVAVAARIYHNARKMGLGTPINYWNSPFSA